MENSPFVDNLFRRKPRPAIRELLGDEAVKFLKFVGK